MQLTALAFPALGQEGPRRVKKEERGMCNRTSRGVILVHTSTSAGVNLQFRTSITVMISRVASSRRLRSTFTNSSVISGPNKEAEEHATFSLHLVMTTATSLYLSRMHHPHKHFSQETCLSPPSTSSDVIFHLFLITKDC